MIESDLILIRKTTVIDIDLIVTAEREPENARFVYQWPGARHLSSIFNPDILHLSIIEKKTNKFVGYAIVTGLEEPDNIELKRLVISDKGKGFGRETIKLIKNFVFKNLYAHRLWLDVRVNNYTAIDLYKSEGFIEEGTLREVVLYNGVYESIKVMSILKHEYNFLK